MINFIIGIVATLVVIFFFIPVVFMWAIGQFFAPETGMPNSDPKWSFFNILKEYIKALITGKPMEYKEDDENSGTGNTGK